MSDPGAPQKVEVHTQNGTTEIPVQPNEPLVININEQAPAPQPATTSSVVPETSTVIKQSPGFFKGEHKHTHLLIVIGVVFELVFGLGVWYVFDAIPQHQIAQKTEATQKTLQTQVDKLNTNVDTTVKTVTAYQKQIDTQMAHFNTDMSKTLSALGFSKEGGK